MFGPFVTKGGRKELKRYGATFTCLASQDVHLKVVNSMDTDCFIMCLRRFIGTLDLYIRRRWRKIQHIANEFWSRWRKEFLTSLQARSKWSKSRHNLTVGDIVLLKTEVNDRNQWPMARAISYETDKNGMLRAAKLRVGKSQILRRPVDKMVLLLENEMV